MCTRFGIHFGRLYRCCCCRGTRGKTVDVTRKKRTKKTRRAMTEVDQYCHQYLGATCVPPNCSGGDYGRCCVEFVRDTNTIILVRVLIQYVGACRLMYHQRNYHGLFCRSGFILTGGREDQWSIWIERARLAAATRT